MLRPIPLFPLAVLTALAGGCGDSPPAESPKKPPRELLLEGQAARARPDTARELRAARDRPRHVLDGSGTAQLLEPAGVVVAGQRARFVLRYTAGAEGLPAGARVEFLPSPFWGWSTPQTRQPPAAGFTTVTSPDGAGLEVESSAALSIRLPDGLEPGQRLDLVYGAGDGSAFVDRYRERGARLWFRVDGDGDGFAVPLADSPTVDVVAGPPARLVTHLPAAARPGAEVELAIAVLDRLGNAGALATGRLELHWPHSDRRESIQLNADENLTVPIDAGPGGVVRIDARLVLDAGSTLEASSNPMLVEREAPRIVWADLHGHSQLSDGTGTVEDYLAYARDTAGLDVVAITDHDHWGVRPLDGDPALVDTIRSAVAAAHDPGRFVALFGYEWTSWIHGHRHVVSFGNELPVISSLDEATDDPEELWEALRGRDVLTFAHHSAGDPIPTDWSFAPPFELEPVTEVASVHGSSEAPDAPFVLRRPLAGNFVRDQLDRGYRLGFVGSGDSHDGHPGLTHLAAPHGGGLAGVVIDGELTRSSVLEALRARRSYATNGPRILVRAALGGRPMGSDVPADAAPRVLYLRVHATAPLEAIELVRSGAVVGRQTFENDLFDFEGTFEVRELVEDEYLYLRVVQRDRGCAWTSPFFVRPPR
ncbi:MAG: CehA/McbA family metallohydrolase [Planctomycetota bacterium]